MGWLSTLYVAGRGVVVVVVVDVVVVSASLAKEAVDESAMERDDCD